MRSEAVLIRSLGVFYYILISIANLVSSEARVRLSNLNYPEPDQWSFLPTVSVSYRPHHVLTIVQSTDLVK